MKFKELVQLLTEMAYPVNFDLNEFSKLTSFLKRKEYCDKHLTKLGRGSSRIAYQVDDDKVLKIAYNKKGIAQNQSEYQTSSDRYDIMARVYEYNRDYLWLEMELAKPLKEKDFMRIYGIKFSDLYSFIYDVSLLYNKKIKIHREKSILYNDYDKEEMSKYKQELKILLDNIYYYLTDFMPTVDDFQIIKNWGLVKRDNKEVAVIVDYGLTEEIFNTYYR